MQETFGQKYGILARIKLMAFAAPCTLWWSHCQPPQTGRCDATAVEQDSNLRRLPKDLPSMFLTIEHNSPYDFLAASSSDRTGAEHWIATNWKFGEFNNNFFIVGITY